MEKQNVAHLRTLAHWLEESGFEVKLASGSLHAHRENGWGETYVVDCLIKARGRMYLNVGKGFRGASLVLLSNYRVTSADEVKSTLRRQQDFAIDFGSVCFEDAPTHQ